jgi:hypothetical protein
VNSMSRDQMIHQNISNGEMDVPSWLQPLPNDDQPEIREGDCDMEKLVTTEEEVCWIFSLDFISFFYFQCLC